MLRLHARSLAAYVVAVVATVLTLLFYPLWIDDRGDPIALVLVLPMLAGAFAGGLGPGLVATVLACGGVVALQLRDATFLDWANIARVTLALVTGVTVAVITEWLLRSRRAEAEGRARFERVFRTMPAAMTIAKKTADGYAWIDVNEAFCELSGRTRDEVLGKDSLQIGLMRQDDLARTRKAADDNAGHVRASECVVYAKDGSERAVLFNSQPAELDGEAVLLTMSVDVTERARAERALRESEERFREIAEGIREVFFLAAVDGSRIFYVSPSFEDVWGIAREVVYENAYAWMERVVDEDRARVLATVTGTQAASSFEYRVRGKGGVVRTIRANVFPVRDEHGVIVRIAGIAEDITEAKRLEEQLVQTQKLESVGRLAGGVAHDFNNLLTVITASLSSLADETSLTENGHEALGDIASAAERATSLTRQLLAFSRRQVLEPRTVDVNALVADTLKMLRRLVGEDVNVLADLTAQPSTIVVDPNQLVQVLLNLAVNARDAMEHGGTLCFRTHVGADRLWLDVKDTGCGMPEEVRTRIFEPFFTTKKPGVGTGLGLAVTHGIVAQAGGSIIVESAPGHGTTFHLSFPLAAAPARAAAVDDAEMPRGTETILYVEDDGAVRNATERLLAVRGFRVITACDGASALSALRHAERDARPVDLLVTDVVMPGINGRELAASTKLPVLYVTGYTDDEVLRRGIEHGSVDLLQKPYSAPDLVKRVRSALDRRPAGA